MKSNILKIIGVMLQTDSLAATCENMKNRRSRKMPLGRHIHKKVSGVGFGATDADIKLEKMEVYTKYDVAKILFPHSIIPSNGKLSLTSGSKRDVKMNKIIYFKIANSEKCKKLSVYIILKS